MATTSTPQPTKWYQTSVGKKQIMAVTGAIWLGYLVVHLIGNLRIYVGHDTINAYSGFLHNGIPIIIWLARFVLIAAFVAHVVSAAQLYLQNRKARGTVARYKTPDQVVNYSSKMMYLSGPVILAFILLHVLHLTTHDIGPTVADSHDVAGHLVAGFQVWYISILYMIAVGMLGFHLIHGVWSFFQTIGLNNRRRTAFYRRAAVGFTSVIVAGNVSIPLFVWLGVVN